MADAFTAVRNDVSASAYNPATLVTLKNPQIFTGLSAGLAEDYFSLTTFGTPVSGGTLAGSFGYYGTGTERLYAFDGTESDVSLQQDILLAASYAGTLEQLYWGVTGKYMRSRLVETYTANVLALDAGVLLPVSKTIAMGAALRNIGSGIKYYSEKDPLPLELRLGASIIFPEVIPGTDLLASLDLPYHINERELTPNLGLEYLYHNTLSFQAGYHLNSDAYGLTLGVGILLEKFAFNYAMGLTDGLGGTHRISLSYRFPEVVFKKKPAAKYGKRRKAARPEASEEAVLPPVNTKDDPFDSIKGLYSQSWQTRRSAAYELGELKDSRAVPFLIKALKRDTSLQVRGFSAASLGKIGDPSAVDPLIQALSDPAPFVRSYAAWALGRMGDRRAIRHLKYLLKDDNGSVVNAASEALKKLSRAKAQ